MQGSRNEYHRGRSSEPMPSFILPSLTYFWPFWPKRLLTIDGGARSKRSPIGISAKPRSRMSIPIECSRWDSSESAGGDRERATRLLLDAAKLRVNKFEKFQRANFEGFQFPHLVDKIMINTALTFAGDAGAAGAADVMLRAGEVVNRDPRDALSDQAVIFCLPGR